MEKNKKTSFLIAGLILLALIACGAIGYLNRAGTGLSDQAKTETALPGNAAVKKLGYCSEPGSICIDYFGLDGAENMLIALVNTSQEKEIYASIKPGGEIYACKKVEFNPDAYYCMGSQVEEGTEITLEVYAKAGDRLLASGDLTVQFGTATPVTSTPLPVRTPTARPTRAVSATPTQVGAYANPDPYPNATDTGSYPYP